MGSVAGGVYTGTARIVALVPDPGLAVESCEPLFFDVLDTALC